MVYTIHNMLYIKCLYQIPHLTYPSPHILLTSYIKCIGLAALLTSYIKCLWYITWVDITRLLYHMVYRMVLLEIGVLWHMIYIMVYTICISHSRYLDYTIHSVLYSCDIPCYITHHSISHVWYHIAAMSHHSHGIYHVTYVCYITQYIFYQFEIRNGIYQQLYTIYHTYIPWYMTFCGISLICKEWYTMVYHIFFEHKPWYIPGD